VVRIRIGVMLRVRGLELGFGDCVRVTDYG